MKLQIFMRILALIITSPLWIAGLLFFYTLQLIAEMIRYGFKGRWEWDWLP